MLGPWKQPSTRWLQELVAELEERRAAAGQPRPEVLWD
jgi:hypothetical protein